MGSEVNKQPHFVLFPLMAQGHMIPMVDIARLLAQRNSIVSIVTTPLNAARFKPILDRAVQSGLQIRVFELYFPSEKAGLPQGCENVDMLPSLDKSLNLFKAACELEEPVSQLFLDLNPPPSCIISDMTMPWTMNIAKKWGIPRISFIGFSCFCMLCMHNVMVSQVFETITCETESFTIPGLPDTECIQLTKQQLPFPDSRDGEEFGNSMKEAEENTFGLIINTFKELESPYVEAYKKAMENKRIWCIGPVSLCNKDIIDKAERGNKTSYNQQELINWLNSQEAESVIYACLGSINNLTAAQMLELGLGLEASKRPFIWVIRECEKSREIQKWISETGFEERVEGRVVVRGWAPQVLILSHPAIGGFLTHCGWNSTLEGISAGLPMVTWPLFADQFCNEKFVVQVVKTGVSVGSVVPQKFGEEEQLEVTVTREDVSSAIDRLMDEGEEKEERKKRAKQLGQMAKRATEIGGSSYTDINNLIQDIMHQTEQHNKKQLSEN